MTILIFRKNMDAYPVLKNLMDVKRFSMTAMFMSADDKAGKFGNLHKVAEENSTHVLLKSLYI